MLVHVEQNVLDPLRNNILPHAQNISVCTQHSTPRQFFIFVFSQETFAMQRKKRLEKIGLRRMNGRKFEYGNRHSLILFILSWHFIAKETSSTNFFPSVNFFFVFSPYEAPSNAFFKNVVLACLQLEKPNDFIVSSSILVVFDIAHYVNPVRFLGKGLIMFQLLAST